MVYRFYYPYEQEKKEGDTQFPFVTTIWSFSNKETYTVVKQEEDLKLSLDSLKSNITAHSPKHKLNGKYKQKGYLLITSILGGKTEYKIKEKSDSLLVLESQRYQVPPIKEEDKDKVTNHYFSTVKK